MLRSGLSQYELARRSGVNQSVISRFMSGQRDLTLVSAEKLFGQLGLLVIQGERPEPATPPSGKRPPRGKGEGK
jgi:transcriptional regulator with XRE-family HTH domain